MPSLRVRLFGKFSIQRNEQELEGWQTGKTKELLCYLLLHRERAQSREILASLFWGDCTTARSRKYFRQALWQLQHALHDSSRAVQDRILNVDGESVCLNSEADLWLDVAVFEKAFAPVRGIAGEQMEEEQAQSLREAASLYQGDLLESCFQDWCLYERERLQNIYLAMLDKLMAYCEVNRDYEDGLKYGELLLHHDRARERTYVRLMRLEYLTGDRAGALRQFQRCVTALQEELGVKPAKRTVEIYEQIRADQFESLHSSAADRQSSPAESPPLPSLLHRLQKLRSLLLKVQHRVQQDIQAVEHALSARMKRPPVGKH